MEQKETRTIKVTPEEINKISDSLHSILLEQIFEFEEQNQKYSKTEK